MAKPRVLIACEESQAVCIEMRKLGIEAYSCDVLPCSGGHPEWHLQQDVLPLLSQSWDMIIAFPPCTYLTAAGVRWFDEARYGDSAKQRKRDRQKALEFVLTIFNAPAAKIAIENPVGFLSTLWRRPDQIIQPWQFGDSYNKATCLWLKGLPPLKPTKRVSRGEIRRLGHGKTESTWYTQNKGRRSKTFPGIAVAMANQWGRLLIDDDYRKDCIRAGVAYQAGLF